MNSQYDSIANETASHEKASSNLSANPVGRSSASGTAFFVIGGIAAAVLTSTCIHFFHDRFEIPADILALSGKMELKPAETARSTQFLATLTRNRGMLAIGAFGALSGALFSLAAARVPGARRSPVAGAVLGLLLGGGFGVIAGAAGFATKTYLLDVIEDDLLRMIGMHATFWIIVGIGIGLAVGITRGTTMAILAAVASSVLGGIIAAGVYAPLAAVIFPNESSDLIVPETFLNRLLWTGGAALSMAVLMARSVVTPPAGSAQNRINSPSIG